MATCATSRERQQSLRLTNSGFYRNSKGLQSREALMLRYGTTVLALVLAMATIDRTSAQRIRAGLLTCDVSAGISFIIGSKKEMACTFTPEGPGRRDDYDGTITKYGLDLGLTGGGVMVWAVSRTNSPAPASLPPVY